MAEVAIYQENHQIFNVQTMKTAKILRSVKSFILKHTVYFGKNWKNDTIDKKQMPKGKA